MRRFTLAAAVLLVATSCGTGSGVGSDRTVLVDWSHDEFASFFIANFPTRVEVLPGTRIVFRQTWTGEPHTVTGGTIVDEMGDTVIPLLEQWGDKPDSEIPPDVIERFEEGTKNIVFAFGENDDLNQTAAQPCYLDAGTPPADGAPCANRTKPAEFTGKHAFFNSGIIPYEGPGGNTFEVKLSENIEPGAYTFYCAVHGPFQRTVVEVKPPGSAVPSADDLNRRAREEIQRWAEPLTKTFEQAAADNRISLAGRTVQGPFAGLANDDVSEAAINEFVPRSMTVKAGEPITWKMLGADHTVSFNVPEYFPIVEFLDDGTVRLNPLLSPPAGGAPAYEGSGPDGPPDGEAAPPEPAAFDAGTWDGGTAFWSSGLIGGSPWLEYTLRITKPGTYEYACLLHPPMVGTIEVTA